MLVSTAVLAACVSPIDYGVSDVDPDPTSLEHDEDGDGIRDAEDGCPTIPVGAGDADGDGVDDECDPQPGAPNRVAYFEAFGTTAEEWASESGPAWTVIDDALEATGGSARTRSAIDGPVQVVATITIAEAAAEPEISASAGYDPDRATADECYLTSTLLINAHSADDVRDELSSQSAPVDGLAAGKTIALASQHGRDTIECRFATTTVPRSTTSPPRGMLRVSARNATIRVHNVIAYRLDL
jgi:hypothetical protein